MDGEATFSLCRRVFLAGRVKDSVQSWKSSGKRFDEKDDDYERDDGRSATGPLRSSACLHRRL